PRPAPRPPAAALRAAPPARPPAARGTATPAARLPASRRSVAPDPASVGRAHAAGGGLRRVARPGNRAGIARAWRVRRGASAVAPAKKSRHCTRLAAYPETPSMPSTRFGILPALILGAAVAFAGWSVGQGVERFRLADRSVTVKGLAELDVKSDFAIWTLGFRRGGSSFDDVQRQQIGRASCREG